jgi:hypothetical protein
MHSKHSSPIALAVVAALATAALAPVVAQADGDRGRDGDRDGRSRGTYVAGDFHNHTTCSDGSISMQKLVAKSTDKSDATFGLDWFVQAGHGGSGYRNCTLVEDASLATPAYPDSGQYGPQTPWVVSGVTPKGDTSNATLSATSNPPVPAGTYRNMWRWQSVQEFQYPLIEYLNAVKDRPLFLGLESVVAGHEHSSMSIITGQIPAGLTRTGTSKVAVGNANALARWEYCFDRADADLSRGGGPGGSAGGNGWDCTVAGTASTSANPSWSAVGLKLEPNRLNGTVTSTGQGLRGHEKTLAALAWMAKEHGDTSYYVPAHLERAGPFNPNGNNGFNVEHLRNFNNVAPRVAFGFETQPGHGASSERGEYFPARNNIGGVLVDSVGGTTYGGTGVYGAVVGGVWDALLGEGRNWWFFASSDWHNRGLFGPDDRRSTQDFLPGEYQRNYTLVKTARRGDDRDDDRDDDRRGDGRGDRDDYGYKSVKATPQQIVDGLRSGDNYATSGQLVDRFAFVACIGNGGRFGRSREAAEELALNAARRKTAPDAKGCATMGEKLVVPAGADVVVAIVVRDPSGTNYAPYSFANPSLAQVGVQQPLNAPVLDHVDVIRGLVTGYKTPGSADYAGQWPNDWLARVNAGTANLADDAYVPKAAKNLSASVIKTYGTGSWQTVKRDPQYKVMSFRVSNVTQSQYLRVRGTNLPAGVPFETDASGNPLPDVWTNATDTRVATNVRGTLRIPCVGAATNEPAAGVVYTAGMAPINGCPRHLPTITDPATQKTTTYVAYDVAAWADLWFYSNPIYVEPAGSVKVAGVL